MKDRVYLVFDQQKVLRMFRTPPNLKRGERFVRVTLAAPESLWDERVPDVFVEVPPEDVVFVAPEIALEDVAGLCWEDGVPAMVEDDENRRWTYTEYRCVGCSFRAREAWPVGKPHFKPQSDLDGKVGP